MNFDIQTGAIGLAVIILNLIPILTRRYKYLILTIIISLILMYLGIYFK